LPILGITLCLSVFALTRVSTHAVLADPLPSTGCHQYTGKLTGMLSLQAFASSASNGAVTFRDKTAQPTTSQSRSIQSCSSAMILY